MKYARILRILGIAIILSMLMAVIPAAQALAATYDLEIDPEEGAIFDEIDIWGTDFGWSDTSERYVDFYFAKEEVNMYDQIDTDVEDYAHLGGEFVEEAHDGSFEDTFEVPDELDDGEDTVEVEPGDYYVYVTLSSGGTQSYQIRAIALFAVIGGDIEIDPEEGPVDTLVEITGESFAASEDIEIQYDGDEIDIEDGDDETDSSGEFESVIMIPESDAGAHTITVIVGSVEVEAEFTVEPDIVRSPQSGEAGTNVTISGTGFARRTKEVTIYFDGDPVVVAFPLDANGSFNTEFYIPEGLSAGSYTIEAEDEDQNLATVPFTVIVPPPPEPTPEPTPAPEPVPAPAPAPPTTSLSISQESGFIGTQLMMGGAGFDANKTVTIKYDDEVVATTNTDTSGIFVATFKVPASKHGDHEITASDGTNTNELTFTLESVAPETPQPLTPEMGVKVKSPISFDWDDVTSESPPVTYALQIATDEDFTADSIILEKTELPESEYILTEAEELKLASQETPYYWRIRAVNAALNEGDWAGAGEFYVTAPFDFPNWALYTLLGIGAVLIFGIGYWLGRRTAFYY